MKFVESIYSAIITFVHIIFFSLCCVALEELLSVCFDLKKLSLEHCTLTEKVCQRIANNANLETLNLAMCYGLCHSYLVSILTQCKK